MKTYKIISITLILIIIVFGLYYKRSKKQYKEQFQITQYRKISGFYDKFYINYFKDNFECPQTANEILETSIDEQTMEIFFKDPLSKKGDLIQYFPVYNKENLRREGFILLSSGIDGKFNNQKLLRDTLYTDNFERKIGVYNDIINKEYIYQTDTSLFNFWQMLFGNKDYLVQYVNCIDYYKLQVRQIVPVENIESLLDKKRIYRDIYGFKGIYTNYYINELNNEPYISFELENFTIRCKLYEVKEFNISKKDSVVIIGKFKSRDTIDKVIDFEKCIFQNLVSAQ